MRMHPRPVAMLAMAFFALFPLVSRAADVHVLAGRSVTSGSHWTTSAFVDVGGGVHEWHGLYLQPVASVGWIKGRHTHYADLDHDVFVAGGGARLVNWWRGAFFSFQVAAAAGRTDAISSAGQFISSLGWRGSHYVVMLRHVSNGDFFGGKNLGETMLMVGVRF